MRSDEVMGLRQKDTEKLERSRTILQQLKEQRGGTLLESHLKMGNDPSLAQAFLEQYRTCNKQDISIPEKYRELIVMAIGMATGTTTTMKVHADLALQKGASLDEICEVIRIIFFTCGVSKLLPILEFFDLEEIDVVEK
jgi:alkylhydroperoxidase/carboxymuconolactone decarboxylase family protein YurZ